MHPTSGRPASCGIDFGTSNSTVGLVEAGRAQLVPLENGNVTLPSALFFNFDTDKVSVGRSAINDYAEGIEGRLLRALKSVLGSSLIHEKTRIKARSLPFDQIIGMFIARLKQKLDEHAGQPVERVVMGRPVHFVDDDEVADRKAQHELERAVRSQGFKQIEFQFEPIAAALDYEQQVNREELALIVDIGGGTSDFSIVRVSPERAKSADRKDDILANQGVHIGGTDFDRLLNIAFVMPELGYLSMTKDGKRHLPAGYFIDLATWHRINRLYTPKALTDLRQIRYEAERPDLVDRMIEVVDNRYGHALATRVEKAKIELTDQPGSRIDIDLPAARFSAVFDRKAMEDIIRRDVGRIADAVHRTLSSAGIAGDKITAVFLTGGSTAIPLVRNTILGLFPQAKVVEGDVFGSVGLGLALDAQRKFG